jgi:uncharacterized cupredoxin-like copper-binding protein
MPEAMAHLRPLLVVCAAFAVALPGCGETKVFRTDRPILRITLDEYRIVPQNVSVKAGRLKFVVRNAGRLTHNLVVQVPPKRIRDRPVEVGRVGTMHPGEKGRPVKLDLQPGEYRLVCTIANHDDLGQFGTLEVK